jgi:hypothetical protein
MAKASPAPRARGGALQVVALAGVVLALVLAAYFPFRWDPPRVVRNGVTRTGETLHFGGMNLARTNGTPGWLSVARRSGEVRIDLDVRPQSSRPLATPIMMLARDYWHTDFAVGQLRSTLLVWLRRPGSDANGNPPLAVGGALRPRHWNRVELVLRGDRARIDVGGAQRLSERFPGEVVGQWGPGQVALGGEVHGGDYWRGRIRRAEVRTAGRAVDYTAPGALAIPARFLYLPDHVAPFPPEGPGDWAAVPLHLLSFVPLGFLLVGVRRPPVRPLVATMLAAAFAVVLAAGKFLFHGRHTEATDVVVQTLGALLGAVLAWWWASRQVPDESGRDRR